MIKGNKSLCIKNDGIGYLMKRCAFCGSNIVYEDHVGSFFDGLVVDFENQILACQLGDQYAEALLKRSNSEVLLEVIVHPSKFETLFKILLPELVRVK